MMGKPNKRNRRTRRQVAKKAAKPDGRSAARDDIADLQQARALWQQNRFDQALVLFDRVLRQHPNNVMALVDASRAYGDRYEIERAEELLDRLLEKHGEKSDVLHLAGQSYRMIHRPQRAIDCFEQISVHDRLNEFLTNLRTTFPFILEVGQDVIGNVDLQVP